MKILVTGGAGYIGSVTSDFFIKEGHDVVVLDNLEQGHEQAVPKEALLIKADLADEKIVRQVFTEFRFDAVAHFAAYIQAGESMQKPGLYFENNVTNSQKLLAMMDEHNVKDIIFSSTAGIYAPQNEPLTEDSPKAPANLYAQTKLMMEEMIRWYGITKNFNYAILRYFNAAGAQLDRARQPIRGEEHQSESHLIPLILKSALGQRDALDLYGTDYPTPDGTCIRDYIHIEDLAAAHVLCLHHLEEKEQMIYNLGNGQGYSNREVIETAREVTGKDIHVNEADRRPGDAPRLIASSNKIQEELGWKPQYPQLKDIIESAWKWHQLHPHGYHAD